MCLLAIILTFFVLAISSALLPKERLLTQYYFKGNESITCKDITEELALQKILNCLVQEFKSSFWYCNINEALMINGEDYECSKIKDKIAIDQQPFLKKKDIEVLDNHHKFEILFKNNISIINGNEFTVPNSLDFGQEIEYKIILLLSNSTIQIFPLILKDICYDQKVAITYLYNYFNTSLKSVMVPTMIISISCAILIIVVYLSLAKLRTMYFVIFHCMSYITHQVLYIHNYKYYTEPKLELSQAIFFLLQAVFIMSAYCWINVFSYQIWTALTRSVV